MGETLFRRNIGASLGALDLSHRNDMGRSRRDGDPPMIKQATFARLTLLATLTAVQAAIQECGAQPSAVRGPASDRKPVKSEDAAAAQPRCRGYRDRHRPRAVRLIGGG